MQIIKRMTDKINPLQPAVAALASGGYALASVQANVNAIAAAQQRLDTDDWNQHQAAAKTATAATAAGGLAERSFAMRPCPACLRPDRCGR